ncbi:polysaccharide deacetylase family protein [Lyngbya aestuarii]|uniref:polysaccharide deacetylase family protein n=1 Tax=Lyngbya aestuarii TaxID=118322 RepID=UPI00403DA0CB
MVVPKKGIISLFIVALFTVSINNLFVATNDFFLEAVTHEFAIFGFHDIIDSENSNENPPKRSEVSGDYTKQDLEKILDYLITQEYWFLSAQELYDYFLAKNQPIPFEHWGQNKVIITVDDGYKSAHNNLISILEKLEKKHNKKVKVVLFVNSSFLGINGTSLKHASCENLREGFQKGYYDIQSHGATHKNLTKLKDSDLELELSESQKILRKCMQDLDPNQTVASHIAYPFGAVNEQVEEYAQRYYLSGYVYNNEIAKLGRKTNKYRISRFPVNKETSVKQMIKLASSGWW